MAGDVEELLSRACTDLARTMASPGAVDDVLSEVTQHVVELLPAAGAGVLLDDGRGQLHSAAATDDVVAGLLAVEERLRVGPAADALRVGDIVSMPDLGKVHPSSNRWTFEARTRGIQAVLAVPMGADERPTGVVVAAGTRPRRWPDYEIAAVQTLADLAAGYLTHERELSQARRVAEQLQEALDRRVIIDQAKGVLAGELGCTIEEAFELLREHARRNSVTVRSVAHAVVHLGLRPPSGGIPRPRGSAPGRAPR